MRHFARLAILGVLLVAGCQSTPGEEAEVAATSRNVEPAEPPPPIVLDELEIGVLPARELSEGECGLFLFTPRPTPRFVFYANSGRAFAEMQINDETVALRQTEAAGSVYGQFFAETAFAATGLDLTARVTLREGSETESGTEIGAGSIQITQGEGWNIVIPVAGAATCQAGQ